ncbi:MAG: hypothetical protein A2Y97_03280 [Nitrospirae bacterium RBG_13_39_12]|nr:MAG: hypothetical protein A2Y97_03280 [Nitrospirae bacterium RBG_13_39_12]
MNALKQKIIDNIKKEGPITFEVFMEMALYEPGLGYYASDNTEIGRAGDFYTSQHVHSIFGTMLGKQIEEMREAMSEVDDFVVVEFGAGEGYMCKDILDYLNKRNLLQTISYVLVEINPFIQKRQKKLLENYSDKVKWVSSLRELGNIKGCILSNELLDAFPVHLIEMEDDLKEIYVSADNNSILEIKGYPKTTALTDYIKEFSLQLPKGFRTEINLKVKEWFVSINDILSEGFILTIDYGFPASDYYSEDRNRGTLLCYYKHQVSEDPFVNIGEQDITAHVNFSSVKKWGEEFGFTTLGFCQQGIFLVSLGIDQMIQEIAQTSDDYIFEVAKIKRLIFPGTIGETHKVMIQYKGSATPELRGFLMKNQKNKL